MDGDLLESKGIVDQLNEADRLRAAAEVERAAEQRGLDELLAEHGEWTPLRQEASEARRAEIARLENVIGVYREQETRIAAILAESRRHGAGF
jgi:L-lactate utilization protein LutB